MKAFSLPVAVIAVLLCSPWPARCESPDEVQKAKGPDKAAATAAPAVKPWTQERQDAILKQRLSGGLDFKFADFANMFLVKSRLTLGSGAALMTSSKEVAEAELQSTFPESYQPTLRELLDSIALQTSSEWKYDPSGKYFQSDVKNEPPPTDLAVFEFTKAQRAKPYKIELAKGWKSVDKGMWTMYVPPSFPVGLDIYEMGSYSSDDKAKEAELLKQIPREVSLMWAKRVHDGAAEKDLKPAKVGRYEALYFEATVPTQLGENARWRQWVFMVDNKCYFVVSTIFPKQEAQIFPDVEAMLKSFKIK